MCAFPHVFWQQCAGVSKRNYSNAMSGSEARRASLEGSPRDAEGKGFVCGLWKVSHQAGFTFVNIRSGWFWFRTAIMGTDEQNSHDKS